MDMARFLTRLYKKPRPARQAPAMKVLIVEDEQKVQNFLKKGLAEKGFTADGASDLDEIFLRLGERHYDAIVLDRLLSGVDALAHLSRIREKAPGTRIIVLSALSDVDDKIDGLTTGADDYLGKPFHLSELVARLEAITRREANDGQGEDLIRVGDLTIHLDSQMAERENSKIDLTTKEYKLLVYLAKRPNQVFSKDDLVKNVWNLKHVPESNVVEVVINRLRNKLDKGSASPLIHSRRGVGYWIGDKNE